LIPLELAVALIWDRVYQGHVAVDDKERWLDSIAATLSSTSDMFQQDGRSDVPARALSRQEVEGGMFRGGGKELRFLDGRPARIKLAVTADDVARTVVALKAAFLG
jgi:hypothetical protein